MLEFVWSDIYKDAVPYIPASIWLGVFAGVLCGICLLCLKRKHAIWRAVGTAIGVSYGAVLVNIVLLSRPPGSRDALDMSIMGTWGSTLTEHAYVIENVLLFIPVGMLIPLLLQKCRKWYIVLLISAFLSVMIESVQFVTKRGFTQLDDVLTNTIGAVAGYVIFSLIYHICKRKDTDEKKK